MGGFAFPYVTRFHKKCLLCCNLFCAILLRPWGHLEAILERLGAILGQLRRVLGASWRRRTKWTWMYKLSSQVQGNLGTSSTHIGTIISYLGTSFLDSWSNGPDATWGCSRALTQSPRCNSGLHQSLDLVIQMQQEVASES